MNSSSHAYDAGTAGADREESCGETANVLPLKAEKSIEVRRISEDLPRLTEAGLAAERAPAVSGFGKVAGRNVLPNLVPFDRRQHLPQGLVRAQEAVEECGSILVDPTRRFIKQEYPAGTGGAADRLHKAQLFRRLTGDGSTGCTRSRRHAPPPAHHGFYEIAVVEIDLQWRLGEIGSGEIKGCLRQVNAVIVAHLGSAKCGLHHTGVAAGNVEKRERRRENIVQGFSKDTAHFAVGQTIAFDQLAVRGPLLLEPRKRRGIHHCAARLELMDMNVYQFRCLASLVGEQAGLRRRADGGQSFTGNPPDRGLEAQSVCKWPLWQG
jgi:hypothetical protein